MSKMSAEYIEQNGALFRRVSAAEELNRLRAALYLITIQDQGAGGRMTASECWDSARKIALEALAR